MRDVCVWFSLIFCPEKQPNGARSTATCDIPFVGIADHHIQTYNGIWVRVRVNEMNGSSRFVLCLFLSFSLAHFFGHHAVTHTPSISLFLDSISIFFFCLKADQKSSRKRSTEGVIFWAGYDVGTTYILEVCFNVCVLHVCAIAPCDCYALW